MKGKKIIAATALMLSIFVFMGSALAIDAGEERVTIGANLDEEQRAQIYKDFGLDESDGVKELEVTNAEEREYLEGLVPDKKIGSVALSCIYIKTLESGEGLTVTTKNINWCTEDMYINALTTAGISDAKVMVSAPFAVSGTAALTGVYKAYEDITGQKLSEDAKSAGAEELVTTGDLADVIGSKDATELVNELKGILDQTSQMTDDEVREQIKSIAQNMNIQLTDSQVEELLKLCRSLEKLDVTELKDKIQSLSKTLEGASEVQEKISTFGENVKKFFSSVGSFFTKLFGGQ